MDRRFGIKMGISHIEETGFDWDLWGPTIDTAFQQDVPLATSP